MENLYETTGCKKMEDEASSVDKTSVENCQAS